VVVAQSLKLNQSVQESIIQPSGLSIEAETIFENEILKRAKIAGSVKRLTA
jgi:hypothetical protein